MLVCALTFQSMVEKNECRLISSTPSGPAPEEMDHTGSVNLARLLFIVFRGSTHSHIALPVVFQRAIYVGAKL